MTVVQFLTHTRFVEIGLRAWTNNLLFPNSTLNSVIFFWRNQILRKEAKLILRHIFKRSQKSRVVNVCDRHMAETVHE